jgi:hypothetical protein
MTVKGNVTLSIATASAGVVGNSTITNLTIAPGNNSFPMTAIVDQDKVITSLDKNGMVEMLITGTSAVYNGQRIPYYVDTPFIGSKGFCTDGMAFTGESIIQRPPHPEHECHPTHYR